MASKLPTTVRPRIGKEDGLKDGKTFHSACRELVLIFQLRTIGKHKRTWRIAKKGTHIDCDISQRTGRSNQGLCNWCLCFVWLPQIDQLRTCFDLSWWSRIEQLILLRLYFVWEDSISFDHNEVCLSAERNGIVKFNFLIPKQQQEWHQQQWFLINWKKHFEKWVHNKERSFDNAFGVQLPPPQYLRSRCSQWMTHNTPAVTPNAQFLLV